MATQFLRLYRELCNADHPDGPDKDFTYRKERLETLHSLGFDVGKVEIHVPKPKYHGKEARRQDNTKHSSKEVKKVNRDELMQKIKFNESMAEAEKFNAAARQIRLAVANGQHISAKFIGTLPPLKSDDDELSLAATKLAALELSNTFNRKSNVTPMLTKLSPRITSDQSSSLKGTRLFKEMRSSSIGRAAGYGCGCNTRSHTATEGAWTSEERVRLNELYLQVAQPVSRRSEAWQLYYTALAEQFRAFRPQRSREEVVSKVKQMLKLRQFKQAGEVEHWAAVQQSHSP